MLHSLQIEGFQSHKKTMLEFDTGVNVIVGSSDSGKSSIVRAVKWLATNRPQGDSFRNESLEPKEIVKVVGDFDGCTVSREKGKNTNLYNLHGIEYKALRADVPLEIQDATKFKEVNIQSQHPDEQYFMLTLSPGQVAKKFNEVAGLEIMDRAMSKINSMFREVNTSLKHAEGELSNRKNRLDSLAWSVEALQEVEEFARREKKIQTAIDSFRLIEDIVYDLRGLERNLAQYSNVDAAIDEISMLERKNHKLKELIEKQTTLRNTIKMLIESNSALRGYSGIDISVKALQDIENAFNTLNEKMMVVNDIKTIIHSINESNELILKSEEEFKIMEREFHELIKICPLCGRSE